MRNYQGILRPMMDMLEAERCILSERCKMMRKRGSESKLIKYEMEHENLKNQYKNLKNSMKSYYPVNSGVIILENIEDKLSILSSQASHSKLKNKSKIAQKEKSKIFFYRKKKLRFKNFVNPSNYDLNNISQNFFKILKFFIKIFVKQIFFIILFYMLLNVFLIYTITDYYACDTQIDFKEEFVEASKDASTTFCLCAYDDNYQSLANLSLNKKCSQIKWGLLANDLINILAGMLTALCNHFLIISIKKTSKFSPFFYKTSKMIFEIIAIILSIFSNVSFHTYFIRGNNFVSDFFKRISRILFRARVSRLNRVSYLWFYNAGYHVLGWVLSEVVMFSALWPYLQRVVIRRKVRRIKKESSAFQYEILQVLQPIEFNFGVKIARSVYLVTAAVTYGPGMPIIFLLIFFHFFFEEIFCKKNFLTISKRPCEMNLSPINIYIQLIYLINIFSMYWGFSFISNSNIWKSEGKFEIKIFENDLNLIFIQFLIVYKILEELAFYLFYKFENKEKKFENLKKKYKKIKGKKNEEDKKNGYNREGSKIQYNQDNQDNEGNEDNISNIANEESEYNKANKENEDNNMNEYIKINKNKKLIKHNTENKDSDYNNDINLNPTKDNNNELDLRFSQVAYLIARHNEITYHLSEDKMYKDVSHAVLSDERTMHREYKNHREITNNFPDLQSDELLRKAANWETPQNQDISLEYQRFDSKISQGPLRKDSKASMNELETSGLFKKKVEEVNKEMVNKSPKDFFRTRTKTRDLNEVVSPFKRILHQIRARKSGVVPNQDQNNVPEKAFDNKRINLWENKRKKFNLKNFADVALAALAKEKEKKENMKKEDNDNNNNNDDDDDMVNVKSSSSSNGDEEENEEKDNKISLESQNFNNFDKNYDKITAEELSKNKNLENEDKWNLNENYIKNNDGGDGGDGDSDGDVEFKENCFNKEKKVENWPEMKLEDNSDKNWPEFDKEDNRGHTNNNRGAKEDNDTKDEKLAKVIQEEEGTIKIYKTSNFLYKPKIGMIKNWNLQRFHL